MENSKDSIYLVFDKGGELERAQADVLSAGLLNEDCSSLALLSSSRKNVPLCKDDNVPLDELVQQYRKRQYLRSTTVTNLAVRKGIKGITWIEVRNEVSCSKKKAQRKLKELHSKRLLFTAQDLRNQGLELPSTFGNRKPQRYFATSIKSNIIEQIKKEERNVPRYNPRG